MPVSSRITSAAIAVSHLEPLAKASMVTPLPALSHALSALAVHFSAARADAAKSAAPVSAAAMVLSMNGLPGLSAARLGRRGPRRP